MVATLRARLSARRYDWVHVGDEPSLRRLAEHRAEPWAAEVFPIRPSHPEFDALFARRFLATHGDELAFDLVSHKHADLDAKLVSAVEHDALDALVRLLRQERVQPHRIADLAVTGDDLIAIGYREGPLIGQVLATLLDDVVTDPSRNDRGWLLERAGKELA